MTVERVTSKSIQQRLRELELLMEAKRVDTATERGQMGTVGHDDLKHLLLEKQTNPYPLRGSGRVDLDPSAPVLTPDEWDAMRGVFLKDCA